MVSGAMVKRNLLTINTPKKMYNWIGRISRRLATDKVSKKRQKLFQNSYKKNA
jgi:hypothetical protein